MERRVGIGEYLDKMAIKKSWSRAIRLGCTMNQLPIVKLSLTGFVVDADPFFYWFNPHRLRIIDFKNDCVDAGFALPQKMAEHVIVTWPRNVLEHAQVAKVIRPGQVKVVDIGPRGIPLAYGEAGTENRDNEETNGNRELEEQHIKPTAVPRKIKKKPRAPHIAKRNDRSNPDEVNGEQHHEPRRQHEANHTHYQCIPLNGFYHSNASAPSHSGARLNPFKVGSSFWKN